MRNNDEPTYNEAEISNADPTSEDYIRRYNNFTTENRLRKASLWEIWIVVFAVVGNIWIPFSESWSSAPESASTWEVILQFMVLHNQDILALGLFLFLDIFVFILSGRSVLVWLYIGAKDYFESTKPEAEQTNLKGLDGVSRAQARAKNPPSDPAETALRQFVGRSEGAARAAQRRPNALMFVGTFIAAVGLVFFLATLPESRMAFTPIVSGEGNALQGIYNRFIELVPRLLMLIFIQILAGFFLRQYRTSMEELRYYEAVLRYRESQLASYLVLRQKGRSADLDRFADALLEIREFSKLSQGETNVILETQRAELNEFKGVFESLADILKSTTKRMSGGDGSKPTQGH